MRLNAETLVLYFSFFSFLIDNFKQPETETETSFVKFLSVRFNETQNQNKKLKKEKEKGNPSIEFAKRELKANFDLFYQGSHDKPFLKVCPDITWNLNVTEIFYDLLW